LQHIPLNLISTFHIKMTSKPVPLRVLGKNGPKVAALGFGLMGLSFDTYGSIPGDEERFAILDRAYELGATFWDSAE
jgi:aryl-alcohol dehydrogenase-like predicted oxidoreductase